VATEGRILSAPDVTGGNPVRTVVQSTQANDEGAVSNKDTQVFVQGDPNTPANLAAVDATGRAQVNIAGSAGNSATVTQALSAAGASTLAGTASTTGSAVLDVSAAGNASFHLLTAAFVGTVVFEQSFDPAGANGTWALVPVMPEDQASAPMNTLAINTAVAYVRQFTQGMFGPKLFRVRVSVFTSGTLTALMTAGPGWVEPNPSLAPSTAFIGSVSLASAVTGAGAAGTTSGTVNTNTVALAADGNRKGLIFNNTGTAPILLGFGFTTTTTLYSVKVPAGSVYEVPSQFASLALNVQSATASVAFVTTTAV
jgi:hypothetical protein